MYAIRSYYAESCTGGLICHFLTNVPGASSFFRAGVVAYAAAAKRNILGIGQKVVITSYSIHYTKLYDAYRGKILKEMPKELSVLEQCVPVYEEVKGWKESTLGIRDFVV